MVVMYGPALPIFDYTDEDREQKERGQHLIDKKIYDNVFKERISLCGVSYNNCGGAYGYGIPRTGKVCEECIRIYGVSKKLQGCPQYRVLWESTVDSDDW